VLLELRQDQRVKRLGGTQLVAKPARVAESLLQALDRLVQTPGEKRDSPEPAQGAGHTALVAQARPQLEALLEVPGRAIEVPLLRRRASKACERPRLAARVSDLPGRAQRVLEHVLRARVLAAEQLDPAEIPKAADRGPSVAVAAEVVERGPEQRARLTVVPLEQAEPTGDVARPRPNRARNRLGLGRLERPEQARATVMQSPALPVAPERRREPQTGLAAVRGRVPGERHENVLVLLG
jgi:hypothetical protein